MKHPPLSARLLAHADALHALAHAVAGRDERLASQIILHAAQAGLMHLAATTLERDLAHSRRTLAQAEENALEQAAMATPQRSCPTATTIASTTITAMRLRHARARIIADILGPVVRGREGHRP